MMLFWILLGVGATIGVISLNWRWASRRRSLPCPSLLAWMLDHPILQRLNGTQTTLDRLELAPGMRVLEIGPGPGRLLIAAAKRVRPGGEVVGIDIQSRMIERLARSAERAGVANYSVILGDATQPLVTEGSFDLVFLCTVLGEIPDRAAALAQCYRALKSGGRLSITELAGDPHYQFRATVRRLGEEAGFRFASTQGRWWFFTSNFVKP